MKKIIFGLVCFFVVSMANAQSWNVVGGVTPLTANNGISSMCMDATGNIYAAGWFTNASGNYYVAEWNGTAWSELGGLNTLAANLQINSICADATGNIYAAGDFKNASGNYYVAKWNGTAWSELGGLNGLAANNSMWSVHADALGNIYAGGYFTNTSGNTYVAKWNGTSWSELGGLNSWGTTGRADCITSDASGNIYTGGDFVNTSGKRYVAKWNGTTWSEVGGLNALAANGSIFSICIDVFGNIYAAGIFVNPSFNYYVAKWNGTSWSEVGGLNSLAADWRINTICTDAAGNIYAAGGFKNAAGKPYVAKWNGIFWSELIGLNVHLSAYLFTVLCDASNTVYTGGLFLGNSYYTVAQFSCVNSAYTDNKTIGNCGSYLFNGQYLTSNGTYYDTIANHIGCDSFITLNLSVVAASPTSGSFNYNICNNSSYFFNGHYLTSIGTYLDTISNYLGCDSFLTLNLGLFPNSFGAFSHTTCSNHPYWFNGHYLSSAGTYVDTITNYLGCDSIRTLSLTVLNSSTTTLNQTVCFNQTYTFNGHILGSSGIYLDTFPNYVGCDSIITLHLTVSPSSLGSFSQTITTGSSFFFNGHNLTTSGTYYDTIPNHIGCDSIIALTLTVNPTGINQINSSNLIKISPNPTTSILNIDLPIEKSTISIYNTIGQLVLQQNLSTRHTALSTNSLPSGLYLVKVSSNGEFLGSQKIVKE